MLNYEYHNPTKLIFGRGTEKKAGENVKKYADKVLLVYGGGSIKRSGLYDEVIDSLKKENIQIVEFPGVEANPKLPTVNRGIELCRKEKIPFVLGVGGGSAIDTAKAIAVGVPYDGDIWDFFIGKAEPQSALPVGTIVTTPATGSESSRNSVITNDKTGQKIGLVSSCIRPVFSILNPERCTTIPMKNLANAVADMMSHIMERYFTNTVHTEVIDGLCESLLRTIMKEGKYIQRHPGDYDTMCELVEAGNLAHNGLLSLGRETDWAPHNMEEIITGIYDCAHGAGLAVVTIAWMKYVYKKHIPMFVQFAVNVMGIQGSFREQERMALDGILALEDFYKYMGLPVRFSELGIDDEKFEYMAKHSVEENEGTVGKLEELTWEDVVNIYRLGL